MEREKMIEEIKGGFTERMRLAKEYNEWLEKEGNKARVVLANNPQTMIAFLQMKGWQEVPEGAVVLTKEEYERLASYISEERAREIFHEETEKLKEKISKETARKFATNLENYLSDIDNDFQTDDAFPEPLYLMREIDKAIDKTLKDFGVEVEEWVTRD